MLSNKEFEEKTIKKVQDGDVNAFEYLVQQYKNRIYSLVLKRIRSSEIAEELAQDIFIKAFKSIQSFRFESAFSTWLTRIAINTVINYQKSRSAKYKEKSVHLKVEQSSPETSEDVFFRNENIKKISDCIDQLSENYYPALTMAAFEGQSYDEIANILSIPVGTVRSRINRARFLVLECMEA